ncbi:hypothetical protein STRIP9103_05841 [Streptomyces ipomoeae 91-03]|uniref:Uncharacterized protein n=1 Tax=Streptomyces ipomoeae 91-03 TaxID=698759 RepID=L1KUC6_9ACTN|nr:hypothetical protein STRIP9103_05841 [Streptomyces ipomoeae 91-03]
MPTIAAALVVGNAMAPAAPAVSPRKRPLVILIAVSSPFLPVGLQCGEGEGAS